MVLWPDSHGLPSLRVLLSCEGRGAGAENVSLSPALSGIIHLAASVHARGSLTPTHGVQGRLCPSSRDPHTQEGMDGATPGDSKVRELLGAGGRQ